MCSACGAPRQPRNTANTHPTQSCNTQSCQHRVAAALAPLTASCNALTSSSSRRGSFCLMFSSVFITFADRWPFATSAACYSHNGEKDEKTHWAKDGKDGRTADVRMEKWIQCVSTRVLT